MMQPESPNHRDERVLIYAPTGRDAALTARFLVDAKLRPEAWEGGGQLPPLNRGGAGAPPALSLGEATPPGGAGERWGFLCLKGGGGAALFSREELLAALARL